MAKTRAASCLARHYQACQPYIARGEPRTVWGNAL